MGINTREELEAKLVAEMVSEQDEITVFEPKTAIRGFITAVAGTIRELWNDLYRMQRKIFLNTASGTDLDDLGAERGIIRGGASYAGVLLTFTGVKGTVIPKGTEIMNPSTYIAYTTQEALTLGEKNPAIADSPSNSQLLGDNVWAVCGTAGSIGNSQVNTINKLSSPIPNVYTVTNLSPAIGGEDSESDGIFRERIRNYISILNQGTAAFYESLCKNINPRILKVKAKKDFSQPDTIKLIIVTSDGSPLSDGEISLLQSNIQSSQRAFTNVICENVKFTFVTVSERVRVLPTYRFDDVFTRTADACAEFFNFKNWDFGKNISVDNVFTVCDNVDGIEDVELASFNVKGGKITNASVTQLLYQQAATAVTDNTITDIHAVFPQGALVNKYVKITSGQDTGEIKQICNNTDTTLTINSKWTLNPATTDGFSVVELYRFSSNTTIIIDEDSIPYFDGLEMRDLNNPTTSKAVSSLTNTNNVNSSQNNNNAF